MEHSEKISIVRAIINDAHYWVPALIIIICVIYMIGRLVILERRNKPDAESKANIKIVDSLNKENEQITSLTIPKKMEPKDEPKKGDTYNVTSNNQTGGITAGRIDKIVTHEEESINPGTNFTLETNDSLTFRVRPKVGKWIQPFFMIPREEKDSCKFEVNTASGMSFDLHMGVEAENNGRKFYGAIFGLGSSVPNPATKDFFYSITFSKTPSYFIFGDHSSDRSFIWTRN